MNQPVPGRTTLPAGPASTSSRALLIKERLAQVPDWACVESGNFLILHSTKVNPESIRTIAGKFQTLLDFLARDFPMDRLEETLFVVRICKDRSQFTQYGGFPDSTGYWSPNEKEMVSYVDETAGKWTLGRIPSLLVHAYLSEALGSVAPHEWFTIGLSGFYSGAPTGTYGGLHPSRNRDFDATLREARAGGTLVPLEQFLRYGRTQFLGPDILRNYAQAWSFVWFLKRQQAPEWKGVLSTYYEALRSGVRDRPARLEFQGDARSVASEEEELIRESAWKAVFGGFDGDTWERLEQAWLDFK